MIGHFTGVMLGVVCVVAPAAWAADFYVAASGRDDGPGTKAKPFATLERARDAVRESIKAGLTKDMVVEIAAGRYELAGPVVFAPADSGTAKHSVTYAAAAGAEAIFSGGRRIGGWRKGGDGIWVTEVADVKAGKWHFDELFVNGRRAVRARGPNKGYYRIVEAGADQRTSFSFREGDIRAFRNLKDVEVAFLHDWSMSRVRIGAVDERARVVKFDDPIGCAAAHFRMTHFERHPRYFLENARELLDAPGEWYLDRKTDELSYIPRPGEEMAKAEVIAPVAERLLEVRGAPDRPVRNLRFVGLTFEDCALPRPERGYAAGQAGFHDDRSRGKVRVMRLRMPAAVELEAARGCVFEGCRIRHVGGAGLSLRRGCEANRIVGCEVADAGGNGVMIGEPRQAKADVAAGNVLTHCHVHDCGVTFFGCVGVWVGITAGTVIERCEIARLPYTGVSVGWQWNTKPTPCKGNRVSDNHIHHVMQVLSDGGGIYTLGRQPGTVLSGNVIHDVPRNAGRAESNGMFIDEGSSQILIEGNTIYGVDRSPLRFHKATTNTIRGNTLATARGVRPFMFNACRRDSMTYEGNTILTSPLTTEQTEALVKAAAAAGPEATRPKRPPRN